MTTPTKPDKPEQVHLGTLIREAREAGGLTRQQMEEQTGVQATALLAIECARHRLSRSILDRLLTSPAMAGLLTRAERLGIPIDLADDPPVPGSDLMVPANLKKFEVGKQDQEGGEGGSKGEEGGKTRGAGGPGSGGKA